MRDLGNVIKKLNGIFVSINTDHSKPFPKPDCSLLSHYRYQRRRISIDPYGRIAGGLSRMVSSLIDFSFIRSIVAHKYRLAGVAYDPVSLFMLELFTRLEKFSDMKSFTNVLRDPVRGRLYRLYVGISEEHIPCEATFSNFKARLGEELYNRIFHVLVRMVELPVACTTIAGNALEGRHFITNKNQILSHPRATAKIHLADAKYDEIDNYAFSRSQGAIPVIDYNPRNENLSTPALKERGYDRNGWPYAGVLCKPNGFDFSSKRAGFSCRRQCVESKDQELRAFSRDSPRWINYNGFTRHMSVKEHPRLITEVIRGTDRHQKLKNLRSASERTNASAKEDFCILNKPKVRGPPRASVLSQLAVIVVLLKRALSFIVNATIALRKHRPTDSGYSRPRDSRAPSSLPS